MPKETADSARYIYSRLLLLLAQGGVPKTFRSIFFFAVTVMLSVGLLTTVSISLELPVLIARR